MASQPRVFTIPASAPFLPTLIAALTQGRLVPGFGADASLAAATLYLPTRRACRLARDLFLDVIGQDAAILPRIVPLGDVDEDEIIFAEAASGELAVPALELSPALSRFERRLLLAELVLKWAEAPEMRKEGGTSLVVNNPAVALALADDLARLLDDMITRQTPWQRLDGLVPDDLDEYWRLTLKFLGIAHEVWPNILAERGAIEAAERRDRLLAAEASRLSAHAGPVIAAGSTGSMPSTAALLAAIACLPRGAVVLPGLDTHLDEAAWGLIAGDREGRDPLPGHPQFAMHALLRRMGIARESVRELAPPAAWGRERLVSEVLRPADATERWQERLAQSDFAAHADAAFAELAVLEADTAEEEALAIAVALREAAEQPGMTTALVTPDRALARRVRAQLVRWRVPVDDSAGEALADTPAGVFARLAAEVALGGVPPVALLALLKHERLRLGAVEFAHAEAIAALERAVLRGPRPRPGSDGLKSALAAFARQRASLHRNDPRVTLADADLQKANELVEHLAAALAPLESLAPHAQRLPLAELAACHREVVAALSRENGLSAAFAGADGEALAAIFDDICRFGRLSIAMAEYIEVFCALLADVVVRPPPSQARVRIFGPLEARLQTVDRLVLGGLVEGVWPPQARADPWLNRPMRQALALDLPERRIGLSAHDFAQALGSREVILTRSRRQAGAPTVASRFLQRLAAVAGEPRWEAARARGAKYLAWARALDRPAEVKGARRPAPKPPLAARPTQLSVTEVEHWLRDPYTIYAKHVLRLVPLEPVDMPPGAADRGTIIHAAIGAFCQQYADGLPPDSFRALTEIGARYFAELADYPEARAFWWPRFERIARWFVSEFEARRRTNAVAIHAEIGGGLNIPLPARSFRLTARADRIERFADGSFAILDYKTGQPPSGKQVRSGLAPQLVLEAAILRGGGFAGITAGASVAELVYVALRGGEPAGEPRVIDFPDGNADQHADYALRRLSEVARKFEDEATPYRALAHPMWKARYGDYDHLARVKEWSLVGGAENEEA